MTVQSVMTGAKPHQNDLLLPGQQRDDYHLLWYRSQRDAHFFCKIRMTSIWTEDVRKGSYRVQEFSG